MARIFYAFIVLIAAVLLGVYIGSSRGAKQNVKIAQTPPTVTTVKIPNQDTPKLGGGKGAAKTTETTGTQALKTINDEDRLALAQTLQDLRPVKTQIDVAIAKYVRQAPPSKQAALRAGLTKALNHKALEAASVEAYAQTYTANELRAMTAYYATPEAQSATKKSGIYAGKVYPHIIKMLDKAMMNAKTGR